MVRLIHDLKDKGTIRIKKHSFFSRQTFDERQDFTLSNFPSLFHFLFSLFWFGSTLENLILRKTHLTKIGLKVNREKKVKVSGGPLGACASLRVPQGTYQPQGGLFIFSRIHHDGHPVQVERRIAQRWRQQRSLSTSIQGPWSPTAGHGD